MHIFFIFLVFLSVKENQAQKFGISQVVSFTNGIIPNILHALSFDHENVVFSPYGLSCGLSMVLEGLDNKLATEIANILHLDNPTSLRPILRMGFKALQEEFEKEKTSPESSGSYNRAFLSSSVPLVPEYKAILEKYYKAYLTQNETSANSTELLLELQTDTGVMSHWKDFDKLAVYTYLSHEAGSFLRENGTSVEVPMIPQVGQLRAGYLPTLNSQAVQLNLESQQASLFLVMPDYRGGLRETLAKMLHLNLADLPGSLPLTETEVSLPQLVIVNSELDLTHLLKRLGLKQIFTKTGPIKSIKQSAYFATSFVSVNSVAATHTLLHKETSPKRRRRRSQLSANIVFNKPFMFFLLHKPTGAALLAGIVKSPLQKP